MEGNSARLFEVLQTMQTQNVTPSKQILNYAFWLALKDQTNMLAAENYFHALQQLGGPDSLTFQVCLGRCHNIGDVLEVFKDIQKAQFRPNTHLFRDLVLTAIKFGSVPTAFDILNWATRQGFCVGREAIELLLTMAESRQNLGCMLQCVRLLRIEMISPSRKAVWAMFRTCAAVGDSAVAWRLWHQLPTPSRTPSTLIALIETLNTLGDMKGLLRLASVIESGRDSVCRESVPASVCCSMIRALSAHSQTEAAFLFFDRIKKRGSVPVPESVLIFLVDAIKCKKDYVAHFPRVVEEFVSAGIKPGEQFKFAVANMCQRVRTEQGGVMSFSTGENLRQLGIPEDIWGNPELYLSFISVLAAQMGHSSSSAQSGLDLQECLKTL